jgi:hypothetical protein
LFVFFCFVFSCFPFTNDQSNHCAPRHSSPGTEPRTLCHIPGRIHTQSPFHFLSSKKILVKKKKKKKKKKKRKRKRKKKKKKKKKKRKKKVPLLSPSLF